MKLEQVILWQQVNFRVKSHMFVKNIILYIFQISQDVLGKRNGHVTPLLKIFQNQKLILQLERPC
jgi:hypothetical protein